MKAVIVGSGIGGLASGIRLLHQGYQVTIYEKNAYTGGKLTAFDQAGYRFDAGPSLFTLPHQIDELFELMGEKPKDHFRYKRLDPLTKYFWDDDTELVAPSNVDAFAKEAAHVLGEDEQAIRKHLAKSAFLYDTTKHVFLEKSLHKLDTYLSKGTLKSIARLHRIDALKTLHQANSHRFTSDKLVQLFNRYATYNGSNPYTAPGTLQVIPHLEFADGAYIPEGGMHEISQAVERLFTRHGGQIEVNQPVERIVVKQGQAVGIQLKEAYAEADLVVSNADIYPTYRYLMPDQKAPEKILKQERSSSALIFYWGMDQTFPELDVHNIFFSTDYEAEFHHLFTKKDFAEDVTVYINITSKSNPEDAPAGGENWFVMVNAPADYGQDWTTLIANTKERVLDKLEKRLQKDIRSHIAMEAVLTPTLIQEKTSSFRGSLYGTSSNNPFAAFLRHPNFNRQIKNLYFVGGSVHPGGGIPLCLLSAQIVSDLVEREK